MNELDSARMNFVSANIPIPNVGNFTQRITPQNIPLQEPGIKSKSKNGLKLHNNDYVIMQNIAAGLNTTKNKMKTSLGKLHNDESGLTVNRQQPRSGTSGTNKHKSKSAGK